MIRIAAAAVALSLLAACSSVDRTAATEFEPLEAGKFRYEAVADVVYPADSPTAEATRMEWLAQYLTDNSLCPNGYEITDRKPVLMRKAVLGDVHRIYYSGICT